MKAPAPHKSDQSITICRSPIDGRMIGHSALDAVESVPEKIAYARAAQVHWASRSVADRGRILRRVQRRLVSRADELSRVIAKDTGKTHVDAMVTEVLPAAMATSYYIKHAKRFLRTQKLRAGNLLLSNKRSSIERVPWGVIAVLSPWNYPFAIPYSEVIMGLLAGNAVILKTASQTQLVGRAMEQLFVDAGLPDGVFTFMNLPGRLAGDALLEGGIDKLFFTGSVEVGKGLMAKAAERLTPVSLELGGNDAMLVCPDADLERAAAGAAWAGYQNAGQSCGGVERIYVHEAIAPEFISELAGRVRSLRVGAQLDQVDVGAMTTTSQRDKVAEHLEDALAKGARVFAQAATPDVNVFVPPTLLVDVDHTMLVMQEETFGPLIAVQKVDSMERAIALANDSNLGLTASVWSSNRIFAKSIAGQLQAGVVTINDHLMSHGLAETPWGGFKESGIGRTHGELGFEEMTQPRCIVDDLMPGLRRDMWWYPHGPKVYQGIRGILHFLYGPSLSERGKGMVALLKLFGRSFHHND